MIGKIIKWMEKEYLLGLMEEDAKTIIKNEFTVISKGLVSKWNNVLEGDTQWIETYKKTLWYSKFSQPDIDSTIFA